MVFFCFLEVQEHLKDFADILTLLLWIYWQSLNLWPERFSYFFTCRIGTNVLFNAFKKRFVFSIINGYFFSLNNLVSVWFRIFFFIYVLFVLQLMESKHFVGFLFSFKKKYITLHLESDNNSGHCVHKRDDLRIYFGVYERYKGSF